MAAAVPGGGSESPRSPVCHSNKVIPTEWYANPLSGTHELLFRSRPEMAGLSS